jgi:hypothetical protein
MEEKLPIVEVFLGKDQKTCWQADKIKVNLWRDYGSLVITVTSKDDLLLDALDGNGTPLCSVCVNPDEACHPKKPTIEQVAIANFAKSLYRYMEDGNVVELHEVGFRKELLQAMDDGGVSEVEEEGPAIEESDDEDDACDECGGELEYMHTCANGHMYQCKECGHEMLLALEDEEDDE